MERRKALSLLLLGLSGAVVGPALLLHGCGPVRTKKTAIGEDDIALMDEIGETIIPATATSPGARAAKIGLFLKTYVTDCFTEAEQQLFIGGLDQVDAASRKNYKKTFLQLSPSRQLELLTAIDKEAQAYKKNKQKGAPDHYFTLMKKTILFGYATSKEGATKGLRYIQTPGHFSGDIPYKKGDKAWAL